MDKTARVWHLLTCLFGITILWATSGPLVALAVVIIARECAALEPPRG